MLQRENRLKKKTAFSATYRVKNFHYRSGIVLNVGKVNRGDGAVKVGFVVSKKTHKRAVKRNRLKRLMRESVRLYLKEHSDLNKYMSLIFTGHTQALTLSFDEVNEAILSLISEVL